ncbi:hypothetical protein Tco_0601992 [Tanacetum coccineum]
MDATIRLNIKGLKTSKGLGRGLLMAWSVVQEGWSTFWSNKVTNLTGFQLARPDKGIYTLKRVKWFKYVVVLQKSLEELKQARARDKDLLEKAKEDIIMQYEEKLKVSFVDNEGRNGERGEYKDCEMFAQNAQQPPTSCP